MNTFSQNIKAKFVDLHQGQGGAVFLLLLAAFLILFMTSMVLYDTGAATGDKVSVQIAADSASFSQSVVKARTMNTVVYANIIKRMYYSHAATYTSSMAALLAWTIINYAIAAVLIATVVGATAAEPFTSEGVAGTAAIASEAIELAKTTKATFGEMGREINALNEYQSYMIEATPWWSYMEGFSRAIQNGATASSSWPPPPMENTNDTKDLIADWVGKLDSVAGSSLVQRLPSVTTKTDSLPLSQNTQSGTYCTEYRGSFEHIIHGTQSVILSDTLTEKFSLLWKGVLALSVAVIAGGCPAAHAMFESDGYLDYRIAGSATKSANDWAQSTSNIAIAYRPNAGRNDDSKGRQKFGFLKGENNDSQIERIAYTNEGYFALSRSEIVYKEAPLIELKESGDDDGGFIEKALESVSNSLSNDEPDMWSPQWTAKSRPFIMQGEELGDSLNGTVGLNTIVNDALPLLGVVSALGIVTSKNANMSSTLHDFFYLLRVGSGFTGDQLQGVSK